MSGSRNPSPGGAKKPGGSNQKPDGPQWGKASRSIIFWIGLFVIALLISQQFTSDRDKQSMLNYNEFMELVESGQVQELKIENTAVTGKLIPGSEAAQQRGDAFKVVLLSPPDFQTIEKWRQDYNIQLRFKQSSPGFMGILIQIVPWILFIGLWIYFLRRMQGGGGQRGIFNFGKSRARLVNENFPKVTFNDVAGADEAKQELQEIIEFLKEPEKFQKLGGKIPKGALLLGPPGTGKTLLAKAVAGEAGVPFFSMSGADFVEMFVGVGASRVRDLFEQGKKNAPCIIFIDELDAVGRHRGAGLGGGHDEREQTLNQLLVEMDGFEFNEGVILLAATNRPDVLDSALLRPGRFDRQIVVDRPDVRGREGILKVHTRKIPLSKNVDVSVIAKGTPGFSGADLANMVNEAALLAARKNKKRVEMVDLEEAKDKVVMGTERKSMLISEKEKESTAYHEAGHVLVAKLTPGSDPVHKVTIIPRGRALGATMTLPMDEKHNYSKTYCLAILRQLLGGRAAEKLIFNDLTTGAGDDIKRSTELARKMVCEWGMSDELGPITYGEKQEEIFLGREIAQHRDYSEETARRIDKEIRKIIEDAIKDVDTLLADNIESLHKLTRALLERESLDGDEIDKIINGEELEPLKNRKSKNGKKKQVAAAKEKAVTES
ncbi:ATP-dependent metallopeptidase FtsH/Yme1/Tma family protein [candidate division KSB1 bacterium]|nr:ATP-dependent zinc metalloprotease FtsH [candidate division KSB1 bacterium]RQW05154.1 MAG: ATP-dependent metallopeptidase FtsH/Yme1/Tma family protein [candidate division KSB1 bacterium]